MKTYIAIIHGQEVEVHVCPPSKRMADSKITKPKHNNSPQRGARWAAEEAGQFV